MSAPTPSEVVAVLCEALTLSLGDVPRPKDFKLATVLLSRQVESLGLLDPAYLEGFRSFVAGRVRPLVPDGDSLDKVLTSNGDPFHAHWLAIAPRHMLRMFVGRVVTPPEMPRGIVIGTVGFPGNGQDSSEE